jgi:predicted O-methyltransferase YrrM
VFLDSDDVLAPTALAEREAAMASRPALDFVVSPTRVFSDSPGDMESLQACTRPQVRDLVRVLRRDAPWLATGPTWRRTAFQRTNRWDPELPCWQDAVVNTRALCAGLRYARIAGGLSYWRRRTKSGSVGTEWRALPYLRGQADAVRTIHALVAPQLAEDEELRGALHGLLYETGKRFGEAGAPREATALWRACNGPGLFPGITSHLIPVAWSMARRPSLDRVASSVMFRLLPSHQLPYTAPFWMYASAPENQRWETGPDGFAAPPVAPGVIERDPRIPLVVLPEPMRKGLAPLLRPLVVHGRLPRSGRRLAPLVEQIVDRTKLNLPPQHLVSRVLACPEFHDSYAFSAQGLAYLLANVERARPRSILELGSGRTTVLWALYAEACQLAGQTPPRITSVDQDPAWCDAVGAALARLGVRDRVDLNHVPMLLDNADPSRHGYAFADGWLAGKAAAVPFDVVLIDGPSHRQGRAGTLPAVLPYTRPGALIYLDDARRPAEAATCRQWMIDHQQTLRLRGFVGIRKWIACFEVVGR